MTRVAVLPPIIDTNPYQRLLHAELEARGVIFDPYRGLNRKWLGRAIRTIDAFHLHWLEYLIRTGYAEPRRSIEDHLRAMGLLGLTAVGARRRPVVWTAHNLRAHEPRHPWLENHVTTGVARVATDVVVHSEHARRQLATSTGREHRVWTVPHGHYVGAYPPPRRSRAEVRAELGVPCDAFLFLSFGKPRSFKRVPEVIQTFRRSAPSDAHLLVYGKPRLSKTGHEICRAADQDPRVRIRLEWAPDEKVTE